MQTCGAHSRAKGVISGSATLSMVLRNALLKILMKDLSGKELIEALQHDRNAPSLRVVMRTTARPSPQREINRTHIRRSNRLSMRFNSPRPQQTPA